MGFMEEQVTRKMDWIEIDGTHGTTWVPAEDFPMLKNAVMMMQDTAEPSEASLDLADEVYEGGKESIQSLQITNGFGARLSAPGYMDCTEWSVFDTAKEAEEYLKEMYGDESEEDESENEAQ